jgi:hypothetical protein
MRRLKRFAEISNVDRLLLLQVLCVVGVARVGLWVLPVAMASRATMMIAPAKGRVSVKHLVWAVQVVSRYLPGATCLTQAVALQALLVRSGHQSRVEIGVAKESGRFKAHAWVVYRNEILVGGPDIMRYAPLTTLEILTEGKATC